MMSLSPHFGRIAHLMSSDSSRQSHCIMADLRSESADSDPLVTGDTQRVTAWTGRCL